MPESHTLGARGCVGILENNKSKATMILNVARMCLRLSIQWSMCLRIASAVQVIRCLAPNVLSRPILRKTLTLQPCLNQLWLSRLLYSAWISGYAMARVFTQFMTQQNGLNFLLKIHINSILRILQDSSIQQQKKTTLTCTEPKPFDHHPVRSLAHYPKRGEEGLKRQASPTCVTTIYHQISVNFDPDPKARTHKSSCVMC